MPQTIREISVSDRTIVRLHDRLRTGQLAREPVSVGIEAVLIAGLDALDQGAPVFVIPQQQDPRREDRPARPGSNAASPPR